VLVPASRRLIFFLSFSRRLRLHRTRRTSRRLARAPHVAGHDRDGDVLVEAR
jgi:hypothetical protein